MGIRELLDLSGKVALVTGGSRGLGLQMAEALAEMGAAIAITARKDDELAAAKSRLESAGAQVLIIAGDLSKADVIPGTVECVLSRFGALDILVNNAGATWSAPAESYPDEAWHKVMRLNVDATFFLTREIARRSMIPRGAGKVINIASVAGLQGSPRGMTTVAYNASKGAVVNLTRALAAEWGPHNINVNAVCPGFFPSKMSRGLLEELGPALIERTPLGRLGGSEDLKGLVALLASEASRHITGQAIAVDGGESIT